MKIFFVSLLFCSICFSIIISPVNNSSGGFNIDILDAYPDTTVTNKIFDSLGAFLDTTHSGGTFDTETLGAYLDTNSYSTIASGLESYFTYFLNDSINWDTLDAYADTTIFNSLRDSFSAYLDTNTVIPDSSTIASWGFGTISWDTLSAYLDSTTEIPDSSTIVGWINNLNELSIDSTDGKITYSEWDMSRFSFGSGSSATGNSSTSIGKNSSASGSSSSAFGQSSLASGDGSSAFGNSATSIGNYSTALGRGSKTTEMYSLAVGYNSYVSAERATSLGYACSNSVYSTIKVSQPFFVDTIIMYGETLTHLLDSSDIALLSGGGTDTSMIVVRVTDTADSCLYFKGKKGISRDGNVAYGNADSTHVNLGVACTTGTSGQNYKYCTVSGGRGNSVASNYGFFGSGNGNGIASTGTNGSILNGNSSLLYSPYNIILNGFEAICGTDGTTGDYAVVLNGYKAKARGDYNLVYGGNVTSADSVSTSGSWLTILNGYRNVIKTSTSFSNILGGVGNSITSANNYNIIGMGETNSITGTEQKNTIINGDNALIRGSGSAYNSVINGATGSIGTASVSCDNNTILNGSTNTIGSSNITNFCTILNGETNTIPRGAYLTINGVSNVCSGNYNFVNGRLDSTVVASNYNIINGRKIISYSNYSAGFGGGDGSGAGDTTLLRGTYSFGMGSYYRIGDATTDSFNTVLNGELNRITGNYNSILHGGRGNLIANNYSVLFGFNDTLAAGTDSIFKIGTYGRVDVDPDFWVRDTFLQISTSGAVSDTFYLYDDFTADPNSIRLVSSTGSIAFGRSSLGIINDSISYSTHRFEAPRVYVDSIYHAVGGFDDSAVVINLDEDTWTLVGAGAGIWGCTEADGITMNGDTIIVTNAGDYMGTMQIVYTGTDGNVYKIRIYSVTDAAQVGYTTASTGDGASDYITSNLPFYLEASAGEKFILQIENIDSGSDPTIRSGNFWITYLHD